MAKIIKNGVVILDDKKIASVSNAGLVKIDGTTITVNNGTISAALTDLLKVDKSKTTSTDLYLTSV